MQRIILVEESKTRLHALVKILESVGYKVIALSSYAQAISQFKHQPPADIVAIVIGWPGEQSKPITDQLESMLLEPKYSHLPLVILSDDTDSSILELITKRPNSTQHKANNTQAVVASLKHMQDGMKSDSLIQTSSMRVHASKKVTILLVDDAQTALHTFSKVLSEEGYRVITADSVERAWLEAGKSHIDLAIIDYYMPEQNGDQLCKRFNSDARFNAMPCVILTGTYSDETIKNSLSAGAVEVMFKNEPIELFLQRVGSLASQLQMKKVAFKERLRYESILSAIGDGVYGVNRKGLITFMNPAARKMLGLGESTNPLGNSAFELLHHSKEDGTRKTPSQDAMQRAYEDGAILATEESIFWSRDGSKVSVECNIQPLPERFGAAGSVISFRDIGPRKKQEKLLYYQATHDSLTDLYNRYRFTKELNYEIDRLTEDDNRRQSAMLFIDLDQFKYLNDTAGHEAGDQLLIDCAKRLKKVVRKSDTTARLGGDEFAVLLKNVDEDRSFKVAETIRKALEECTYISEEISFKLSCTMGIAMLHSGMTQKDAMVNADIACNVAKNKGRNMSYIYDEEKDADKETLRSEMGWSTRLNDAIANDGFVLFYQPILPLSEIDFEFLPDSASKLWTALSHLPEHYECLLRMVGEEGEYISPFAFLNVAERFNLMPAIDVWVVNAALTKLRSLQIDGRDINFSINLSGSTLNDMDSLDKITAMMRESDVAHGSVLFEITETSAIEKKDEARQFIETMRSEGWRFALDDFGTGFSSFSQLKELPVDVVKIDGQFVRDMANDPIDRAIVMAINDIAHSQNMETIAEYVEDAEILRLLNICGVDHAQGYYIAKPLLDVMQRADNTQMLRLVEPITGA